MRTPDEIGRGQTWNILHLAQNAIQQLKISGRASNDSSSRARPCGKAVGEYGGAADGRRPAHPYLGGELKGTAYDLFGAAAETHALQVVLQAVPAATRTLVAAGGTTHQQRSTTP